MGLSSAPDKGGDISGQTHPLVGLGHGQEPDAEGHEVVQSQVGPDGVEDLVEPALGQGPEGVLVSRLIGDVEPVHVRLPRG